MPKRRKVDLEQERIRVTEQRDRAIWAIELWLVHHHDRLWTAVVTQAQSAIQDYARLQSITSLDLVAHLTLALRGIKQDTSITGDLASPQFLGLHWATALAQAIDANLPHEETPTQTMLELVTQTNFRLLVIASLEETYRTYAGETEIEPPPNR